VGPKDAELVDFGIGENDPRSLSLADVHSRGAKCKRSFDLRVADTRAEVKVQPIS
jgi:hypothetical protein